MTDSFKSPALERAIAEQDEQAIRTLFEALWEQRQRAEGQRDALFVYYEGRLKALEPNASTEPTKASIEGAKSKAPVRTADETTEELGL